MILYFSGLLECLVRLCRVHISVLVSVTSCHGYLQCLNQPDQWMLGVVNQVDDHHTPQSALPYVFIVSMHCPLVVGSVCRRLVDFSEECPASSDLWSGTFDS